MGERGARALLRLCLLAWPRRHRNSHGKALLETVLTVLGDARPRGAWTGLRELAAEALALVGAGLALRWSALATTTREWTTGGWGDLRLAARTLHRSPGFASVAVVMLALGIGANAAVFSLVDGVLLKPPSYRDPQELVLVWNSRDGAGERVPVSGPDAAALAGSARSFSDVAFTIRGVNGALETGEGDEALHLRLAAVTDNFFAVLGADPALGRVFGPGDGPSGVTAAGDDAPTAVVLADGLWRSAFGADPAVLGRRIRVNGAPATVVGVMDHDFSLALPPDAGVATDVDAWIPLSVPLTAFHRTGDRLLDQDSDNTGAVVARLAPGATLARARGEADRIARDLAARDPAYAAAGLGFDVRPLQADATAHARGLLVALLAGAAGVLVIVCLNLATLVMARGIVRSPEMSLRVCLGASTARVLRQNLSESLVLVGLGFTAAMVLAHVALAGLARLIPPALAPPEPASLDVRSLVFGASVAGCAVLLFGLLPGLRAGAREARGGVGRGVVRTGGTAASGRSVLVAVQVAVSVVLMLCAGLFLRTVAALDRVEPGFQAEGALTFKVSLRRPSAYAGPADRARLMKDIERGVRELPGVRAVGLTGVLPLGGGRWIQPYGLPGQAESQWQENRADFRVVTSGTFDALGTRVLEGRSFTVQEDLQEDERVVVVDRRLAARVAPGGSALNAVLGVPVDGAPVKARIVGVVESIHYDRLEAEGREAIYVPYRQEASREVAFVVRAEGDPMALAPAIRRAVRDLDPRIPVYDLESLDGYVRRAVAPRRFAYALLMTFAVLALLCAATGLYGLMAFDVSRQTRDLGVRMAVGATRGEVSRFVLGRGLRLGVAGLAMGMAGGAAVAGALRGLVFGVGPADPTTWAAVCVTVAVVVVLASWLPAVRAGRLSPTAALRSE